MSIASFHDMNDMHIDVLRELANIGSGNAASSLSRMLNNPVDIAIPDIGIRGFNEAYEALLAHFQKPEKQEAPIASARPPREDLARKAEIVTDTLSGEGSFLRDILNARGWRAEGNAPWEVAFRFRSPAILESFRLESLPLPFVVRRLSGAYAHPFGKGLRGARAMTGDSREGFEEHALYLKRANGGEFAHPITLPIHGDRDIALTFPRDIAPVIAIRLVTKEAQYPPAWKNLRIYGYFAG